MRKYIYSVLCGIVFVGLTACSTREPAPKALQRIKVEKVVSDDVSKTAVFSGKVMAASEVNVSFKVSGGLLHLKEVGTAVKKGEILAEMDPRDYRLQFSATQAEYQQIKGECERVMSLYEKKSVSQNDYEKALYGLQQITAKYNAHKNALEDCVLRAPFDGYVQKHYYREGEIVGQGMPVISMVSSGALEVLIHLPMSEYMRRDEMQSYTATIDVLPDNVYPLEWIGLSPKANVNQLYELRFQMPQQDRRVMPSPGMPVNVQIHYRPAEKGTFLLPLSALLRKNEEWLVWVYEPKTQTVQARKVNISNALVHDKVAVISGLTQGEYVVTAGVHSLSEGEKVKVLADESSSNVGGLL